MKKVIVVGGAGYIGGYLVDVLMSNGYDVTVLDNLTYESRYLKNVKFIHGDINEIDLVSYVDFSNYEYIIWLAALVGDGACQVDIELTNNTNFLSVKRLVDSKPSSKIIFMSTCSVYGINHGMIDENTEVNPLSAYATTKFLAEQYIIDNANDYLIFRLGTLFGLGDSWSRLRLDLIVNLLVKKAVNGEPLTVFGGDQWRPLLHVKDVANAIVHGIINNISGLYNLAYQNFKIISIAEYVNEIIPCKIITEDMPLEDLRNYKVSYEKYLSTGWTPSLELRDGISELKKVFEERRIKDPTDPIYSNAAYINRVLRGF